MQGDRRLRRCNVELRQRSFHRGDRLGAGLSMHDQFADHAVVIGGDAIAGIRVAVDAEHRDRRARLSSLIKPGLGAKFLARILSIDSALDRVAGLLDVLLLVPQRLHPRRCGSVL